jgi:diguanylate cyclase (GGDEF)-like protein
MSDDGTSLVAAMWYASRYKDSQPERSRSARRGLWLVVASLVCLPVQAQVQTAEQHPLESLPIRTVAVAHNLSVTEAARGLPVLLRANVTYYSPPDGPWGQMLFVSDATGGVFVNLAKPFSAPLREGTLVEVKGTSAPGDFAALVGNAELKVLDVSSTPVKPSRMTRSDLVTGSFDCWPVEVQGLVHSVRVNAKDVALRISTNEGPIVALILREPGVDYQQFADAAVVVHGVAAPDFNQHRQMTGFHLFVQSARDVSTLVRGGGDPFASEVRPIGHLGNFDPRASALNRLHVRGLATLNWPGRLVCLQDASGGLCVPSDSTEPIPVGSPVDVAAYPAFAVAIPAVEDAVVRAGGTPPAGDGVAPRPVRVKGILAGEYSGELVSLEGQLIGVNSDARNWQLTLISDGVVYAATVPREVQLNVPSPWLEGSYVRVVGVCQQEVDAIAEADRVWTSDRRFKSFRVLMRTKRDVTVLRAPSWWTPARTVLILSATLILTMAGFGWVVLLRRRVEQRTEELRASEARFRNLAHHDPLTGAPNRALFQDRAEIALARAKRHGHYLALLLLDLDHFKPINDTYGHEAGDKVLCVVVERALGAVRKSDTVARLGGDEFAVLLSDLDSPDVAVQVAEKLLEAVCRPMSWKDREIAVSASIGVAIQPDDGICLMDLLRNADAAMYESKQKGSGGVERYRKQTGAASDREPALDRDESTVG